VAAIAAREEVRGLQVTLPSELAELQGKVRQFAREQIAPVAKGYDWDQPIPAEAMAELQAGIKSLGLWLLHVPERYGGLGANLLTQCVVEEEVAQEIILGFGQNELFGPNVGPILYESDAEQTERFLLPVIRGQLRVCFAQTEPEAGSDPAGMRTTAVRDGDGYVLNGTKRFIGNADRSDYAQVICRLGNQDKGEAGESGFLCLMVPLDAPGVALVRRWPTISGTAPWEIQFQDVRVPGGNRIGERGAGFALAQKWLTVARIKNHGARCVGIAQRAVEMAMDYAADRVTFGDALANRQAVQFMIADSAVDIWASRLMVHQAAALADAGQDVRNQSYMIKAWCPDMATRAVDRSMQIHGGIGLTRELPLEYWYRYLRTARITEGPTEVLRWRLARNLMRQRGKERDGSAAQPT
jgi:acyl-CoA dehydrogenase